MNAECRNGTNGTDRTYTGALRAGDGPTRHRVWIRAVRETDLKTLRARAAEDGHEVIAPTHVFVRIDEDGGGEEIIGCASLASVALLLPWFDTKRCHARDSLYLINVMENLLANMMNSNASGLVCVPVVQGSPFERHIERLGYINAGPATVTFKKVK